MSEARADAFRRLHVEIVPRACPRPTVFIHGNMASNVWWQPLLAEPRMNPGGEHPAILAAWRGCGRSAALAATPSQALPTLARDYVDLVTAMGVSDVDVVAHSMGGLVALHAVSQAPALFRRMVLLDPVSHEGLVIPPDVQRHFGRMARDLTYCREVMRGTILGDLPEALMDAIVRDAFHAASALKDWVPAALAAGALPHDLSRIPHPALVLHGEHDRLLAIGASRALAEGLPQGCFRELAGRGHSCNVEDPALFARLVQEFFTS